MNIQSEYSRLLADTARRIIHQDDKTELVGCEKCGSVSVGECRCPTYDPIPPLSLKDVLTVAGYNLKMLSQELMVCANCFEEYEGASFEFKGLSYCCRACAEGGICVCEPVQHEADESPEPCPSQPNGLLKVNSFWNESQPESDQIPDGSSPKHNKFWSNREPSNLPRTANRRLPKTNAYWES